MVAPKTPGVGLLSALAMAACQPPTVSQAEAKGDVVFLEQTATPDAVAALGRLADKDPKAQSALQARAFDGQVYKAAWAGVLRDALWAPAMLRQALADPTGADLAASQMGRHDVHLTPYTADLEAALVRLSASRQNWNVAAALASIGPKAHEVIVRRLLDASTRGALCRVLGADASADPDARRALLEVPDTARDDDDCVGAAVGMAATDDEALAWLAERAETGLLGAGGKDKRLPCTRLQQAWVRALATRPRDLYPALSVPLGQATVRCPREMDAVLADTLLHRSAARSLVVRGVDPYASYGGALTATCAALRSLGPIGETPVLRERAADTLAHACTQ